MRLFLIQGKLHYIMITIFRNRIHKMFENGDSCVVYLKNRGQRQKSERHEDEVDWYEKAFGKK